MCPDPKLRDPAAAVTLAKGAVERAPKTGDFWNTLGLAQYRAEAWEAAIGAAEKSTTLHADGNGVSFLVLAMAHWRMGRRDQARMWFARAIDKIDVVTSQDDDLHRLRRSPRASGRAGVRGTRRFGKGGGTPGSTLSFEHWNMRRRSNVRLRDMLFCTAFLNERP